MEERKRFLIEADIKGAETMFGASPLHICIPLPLATLVTSDRPKPSSVHYASYFYYSPLFAKRVHQTLRVRDPVYFQWRFRRALHTSRKQSEK